jgi:hypothetical protein
MSAAEGLAIIPWPGVRHGPADQLNALATAALGDRCFVLDADGDSGQALRRATAAGVDPDVLAGFASAAAGRDAGQNREELDTGYHALAAAAQLLALVSERGYAIDPGALLTEAWGASFEGCVTKYSLYLRHALRLGPAVPIPYALTVPDARFLVAATEAGGATIGDRLRVFIFEVGGQLAGLFTATTNSLKDSAARVWVPLEPGAVTVLSKQGIRLWPRPESYRLERVPSGYREAPQQVVQQQDGGLVLPVSAGLVYRLARSPAFVFAPRGLPEAAFRDRLLQATAV